MTTLSLNPTPSNKISYRYHNLAFILFCLSTAFIILYSVQAIYNWPPLAEKLSIFLACTLPIGMIILGRANLWLKTRQFSRELIWVFLILTLGLLSCLLSENKGASLKSMGLFLATGPFVFFTANVLFESKKNQESYLWISSLCLLALALWGIYEHFSLGIVYLFSRNPLPAGVMLILLSAGPMILLNKTSSLAVKLSIFLSLSSSFLLIILMTKKSHLLGLLVLLISLSLFSFRKYHKFFLGFIFFIGLSFFASDSLKEKYKNIIYWPKSSSVSSAEISDTTKYNLPLAIYGSIPLRAENYSFGFHVIRKSSIWGLGFGGNLDPYFKDYELRQGKYFSKSRYKQYIKSLNTFENIILTYTIEWGCLFALTYFGGITYIIVTYFMEVQKTANREIDGIFVIAIIISFSVISFTFDTLRFPNINWAFHTLLGLLVNFPKKQQEA
jgi:hypothetical protein